MTRFALLPPLLLLLSLPLHAQEGSAALQEAVERRIARGDEAYKNKDYEAARAEYAKAIELNPEADDIARAYWGRGSCWYMEREYEKAIAEYKKAAEVAPEYATAYFSLALTTELLKDYKGAIGYWDKYLDLNDGYARAWIKRADCRMQLVDYAGAYNDYTVALEIEPANKEALMRRAKVHEAMGNWEGAITDYGELIKIDANYAACYRDRARAHYMMGNRTQCLDDFEAALFLEPKGLDTYILRGRLKMMDGDYEGGIEDLDAAVKLDEKAWRSYFTRALIHYNFGNWRKARIELLKSIKRANADPLYEPDYPNLYLCLVQRRLRKVDEGVKTLKEYVASRGDKADPWFVTVANFLAGSMSEKEFLSKAKADSPKTTRERECEAFFYAGEIRRIDKDEAGAYELFQKCVDTGVHNYIEYETSRVALKTKGS